MTKFWFANAIQWYKVVLLKYLKCMNLTPEMLKLVSHVLVAKPFWSPFFGFQTFCFLVPSFYPTPSNKGVLNASSRHYSNLNFARHFVIYWLFQNGTNKNQHQDSYQRETVSDKFVFFSKLIRQKKSIGWAKYVYACEWDMCWRNFCNFSLVTKKCEK